MWKELFTSVSDLTSYPEVPGAIFPEFFICWIELNWVKLPVESLSDLLAPIACFKFFSTNLL